MCQQCVAHYGRMTLHLISPIFSLDVTATCTLQVLGAVVVIARLNPGLAVVALALTPLLSSLIRLVVVRTARLAYRQQTAAADALSFADERLSQVPPPLPPGGMENTTTPLTKHGGV